MNRHMFRLGRLLLSLAAGAAVAGIAVGLAVAFNSDTLVSVGSPTSPFSQNKQYEPAVAIDADNPNILVAAANDNIDLEACNAGDDTTCPFSDGVGATGVYFSFNGGDTWTQPTYTGWTARNCTGAPGPDAPCAPHVGPVGGPPRGTTRTAWSRRATRRCSSVRDRIRTATSAGRTARGST